VVKEAEQTEARRRLSNAGPLNGYLTDQIGQFEALTVFVRIFRIEKAHMNSSRGSVRLHWKVIDEPFVRIWHSAFN